LLVTVPTKGSAVVVSNTATTLTVATSFTSAVANTDAYSIANGPVYALVNSYGSATFNAAKATIAASGTTTLQIAWEIPNAVGNEIQGDSCTFDVNFQLRQAGAPGL